MTSAAILLWALYPEEPNLSGNAGYQKENPAYYPGGSDCHPSNLMRLTGREGAEAAIACGDAGEQHRLDTNDLIQQRRSADAADAMAILAYKQALVAAWGAVFGFLTLCAAVAAAIYAGVAATAAKAALVHADGAVSAAWQTVDQAKAATLATQEAVGVTREIGQAQVRAYISVSAALPKGLALNQTLRVKLTVKNTGQSPAHSVVCRAMLVVRDCGFDGNEDFTTLKTMADTLPILGENLGVIPSGSSTEGIANCRIVSERDFPKRQIDDGYVCFAVVAIVAYRDVFNKTSRQTRYCAILEDAHQQSGPKTPNDWEFRWQPTRFHNDAT